MVALAGRPNCNFAVVDVAIAVVVAKGECQRFLKTRKSRLYHHRFILLWHVLQTWF
jgi:hypothetical protein